MSDSEEEKEIQLKLVVVGDGACGKVNIFWSFKFFEFIFI